MVRVVRYVLLAIFGILPLTASSAEEIHLAWDPNTEPDLAGYRIYVGTSPDVYSSSIEIGLTSSYTVRNLQAGERYYFALTAYDSHGNESLKTNAISALIPGRPNPEPTPSPSPTPTPSPPDDRDNPGPPPPDDRETDSDGDGLSDALEREIGTNPFLPDSDNDGISDSEERESGTDPLDRGSRSEVLSNEQCIGWNRYLGMWNIFEAENRTRQSLRIDLELYNQLGVSQVQKRLNVPALEKRDVLVHDEPQTRENAYGLMCARHDSSAGALLGAMVFYRRNSNYTSRTVHPARSAKLFQFAFAVPFSNGKIGPQYVPFNTYQPSLDPRDTQNLVTNWIQITNASSNTVSGSFTLFDMNGEVVSAQRLSLSPRQRKDVSAGHSGSGAMGYAQWLPDTRNAQDPVKIENIRYVFDNPGVRESFDTAFQIPATYGTAKLQVIPLDTRSGSSIVEIANVSTRTVNADVRIYSSSGEQKTQFTFALAAHSTRHIITDEFLGLGQRGIATIFGDQPSSLMAISMRYARRSDGGINHMYGVPGRTSRGARLSGSYNTYLEQLSLLHILNPTNFAQSVSWSMNRHDGTTVVSQTQITIPAKGSTTINLNQYERNDNYGTVELNPVSTNSIVAWLTRERANDYTIVTPVRE